MKTIRIPARSMYYGTPVALVCMQNSDGSDNLTPMSSSWSIRDFLVLGLGSASQAMENLRHRPRLTVNLPSAEMWESIERIAAFTGRNPVPDYKAAQFSYCRDKFEVAGLTRLTSTEGGPSRVAECPIQIEAVVNTMTDVSDDPEGFSVIIAKAIVLHAAVGIINETSSQINPAKWDPLVFSYGTYHGLGPELGRMARSVRS
ncbi:flavin reductase family protein [Asaia sp. As-1742]|uniref:flavin reductase family protein n=1 Tax=Asaia sp. As-1742 TaxID=2608325 RepID=UPI001421729D|nr:flavin reductase [Asaia sp. As-1742]NIE81106.1 flavin reductase family protein [Asaia sp. As-1742]